VRALVRRRASVPPELAALGLDVVEGDLRDADSLAAALDGVEHVYHLARGYGEQWDDVLASDVEPTQRLAELCLERGVRRLVYASSVVIYDAGDPRQTLDESTPPGPGMLRSMTYARGKAECERRLLELHRERALPVEIVRPGIVVGRGASPMHFGIGNWPFPGLCDVWGAGRTPLPLVLVDDVADGLARCAEVEGIEGESFNLVGPPLLTAREYLDELERCTGTRIRRRYVAPARTYAIDWLKWAAKSALGLPARARPTLALARARTLASPFDTRRARERLGWSPCADRAGLVRRGIAGPAEDWLG
jgi:nucleoside-diphosphate-sugar epimerase